MGKPLSLSTDGKSETRACFDGTTPPHLFLFTASLGHRARLFRSCESSALPQVVHHYPRTDAQRAGSLWVRSR